MIDLYLWPTGNNKKVVIALEELGLAYTIRPINIGRGDQFGPEFLKISPNNRVPAIIDHEPLGGGKAISIFESGAILMYLAEKAGCNWFQEPHQRYGVIQWVVWQAANQGPKMGEQGHFRKAAENPENGDLGWAVRRFDNETHRLFGVLELGLFNNKYLAGDIFTIADIAAYPWASLWQSRDMDIEEFPRVKAWLQELGERPAVKMAMALKPENFEDPTQISPEEKTSRGAIISNQRARPIPQVWLATQQLS